MTDHSQQPIGEGLLPCPFCGGDNVRLIGRKWSAVKCDDCCGYLEHRAGWTSAAGWKRSEAIAAWNRRAESRAPERRADVVRGYLTADQRLDLIELLDQFRKDGSERNNWQLGKYADKIEAALSQPKGEEKS